MTLGNTPRVDTSFHVEANRSFAFGVHFQDAAGKNVDLTGAKVRLVAIEPPHLGGSEVISKLGDTTLATSGTTQFNLQASDLALDPESYPYDMTLVPSQGYSIPVLKGLIEVGPNVDTDITNTYVTVLTTSLITVVLEKGAVIKVTATRG